ncbi:heavy-metal-associated domain-containing protein [Domibacillus indicus]|uniref:heavy-metal-associated domain-containing protein n=1 Tax=Domibacillus indicus TaxID=1437523 RepID=UPI00203C88FC|nr:heavy metal-associated domain-containing protein [Domibacillus indicus]MCM3789249.1 heavy-metal-associated domain-containing protein [Domibacillus indicus]
MQSGSIMVKDMHSMRDADTVLDALLSVWGIGQAEINLEKNEAVFTYDERMASSQDFEQAIVDSGFTIYSDDENKLNVKEINESHENM